VPWYGGDAIEVATASEPPASGGRTERNAVLHLRAARPRFDPVIGVPLFKRSRHELSVEDRCGLQVEDGVV
jgi:hypothetical protein